jgi:hypothetical protein
MSRVTILGSIAASAAGLLAMPAMASEAYTTRIEPRVFYGATVTLEEGVRVFRPLPPHKHVVINPDNKAPVSLSFNESVEKSYNYFYDESGVPLETPNGFYGGGVVPFGFGRDGFKHRFRDDRFGGIPAVPRNFKKHHGQGPR